MDKRTVIAFALIGLILILMPYYMQLLQGDTPQPSDPVEKPAPRQTKPPQITDTPLERQPTQQPEIQQPPVQDEKPASTSTFRARDIVIDAELYRAVISTRGGVITSWQLKTYFDGNGNWLEVMAPNGAGLGATIASESLNSLEFIPDRDRLDIYGDTQDLIVFRAQSPRGPVEKRFRFQGNRYRIHVSVIAEGLARDDKLAITWDGGLADTENKRGTSESFYEGAYEQIVTYMGGEVETWDTDRLQEKETPPSGQLTWIGVRNKYFLAAVIPNDGRYDLALYGDTIIDPLGFSYRDFAFDMYADSGLNIINYSAYVGPISYNILRAQNRDLDGLERELDLDDFVDYGPYFVRAILKPVTILILKAFLAMHALVPNYGVVIILFSILVKVVVFPLTHKSLESTAKMQTLQPKIAELRERYAKDQQKMNTAMMKLYREEKINPIGGCLPMVLQMPILFSLFSLFRGTIELRQAGFALWITDLSQPDTIPIGGFDLHLLPLLMGVSMFIQQKMMMKDPKQAVLVYIMPVFLTYIFWTMSSGLVFYYTLYNVLTLAQQIIMERTKSMLGTS